MCVSICRFVDNRLYYFVPDFDRLIARQEKKKNLRNIFSCSMNGTLNLFFFSRFSSSIPLTTHWNPIPKVREKRSQHENILFKRRRTHTELTRLLYLFSFFRLLNDIQLLQLCVSHFLRAMLLFLYLFFALGSRRARAKESERKRMGCVFLFS